MTTQAETLAPHVAAIAHQLGRIADALGERNAAQPEPFHSAPLGRVVDRRVFDGVNHPGAPKNPARAPEQPAPAPMAGPDAGRPSERRTAVSHRVMCSLRSTMAELTDDQRGQLLEAILGRTATKAVDALAPPGRSLLDEAADTFHDLLARYVARHACEVHAETARCPHLTPEWDDAADFQTSLTAHGRH